MPPENVTRIAQPAVLFLCVHNAGRSRMAAGWMTALGKGAVTVFSAGSEPAESLNPLAVRAMAEVGIDIAEGAPRRWTREMLDDLDVVVTMGCGDECPYVHGTRYVDWDLADPAGQPLEVVRLIRDEIRDRVEALLVELSVAPTPMDG